MPSESFDAASSYRRAGLVSCRVVSTQVSEDDGCTFEIDTAYLDQVETIDGPSRFVVSRKFVLLDDHSGVPVI